MKFVVIVAIVFGIMFSCFSAEKVDSTDSVIKILSARMCWEHQWGGSWDMHKKRRIRCVLLDEGKWVAAFEVFAGDFGRSREIKWQIVFVKTEGDPKVDFLPCLFLLRT